MYGLSFLQISGKGVLHKLRCVNLGMRSKGGQGQGEALYLWQPYVEGQRQICALCLRLKQQVDDLYCFSCSDWLCQELLICKRQDLY